MKGGIFLYALYRGDYPRSTTDIDLLAQRISNAEANMKTVFTIILSQKVDDPLRYDLDTLNVTPITEFKEYHGVNVSVTAVLDRTKIPISIDIGFNDLIYPEKTEMDFPITLEDNSIYITIHVFMFCHFLLKQYMQNEDISIPEDLPSCNEEICSYEAE